jgi:hypothetical protein
MHAKTCATIFFSCGPRHPGNAWLPACGAPSLNVEDLGLAWLARLLFLVICLAPRSLAPFSLRPTWGPLLFLLLVVEVPAGAPAPLLLIWLHPFIWGCQVRVLLGVPACLLAGLCPTWFCGTPRWGCSIVTATSGWHLASSVVPTCTHPPCGTLASRSTT